MKNLPHDIISAAFKSRYSNSPKAIINDLFKNFAKGTSKEMKLNLISDLLNSLETKGFIKWGVSVRLQNSDKFAYDESFKNDFANKKSRSPNYDIDNTQITVWLTPEGIDYALDIDRKRVQHRNNYLAIIFAGLTVLLTGISLYKTITTQSDTDRKLQILQMKLQSKDSLWQNSTSRLDSLIEVSKKDSLQNSRHK